MSVWCNVLTRERLGMQVEGKWQMGRMQVCEGDVATLGDNVLGYAS